MKGHVIVVGASSGIGAAIADHLASSWTVTRLSRRTGCDVRDTASLDAALDRAGRCDALVYSAGVPVMGRTLMVPEETARDAFEVNYWGLERCIRRVYPRLAEQRRGSIIAVLSIAATRAVPFEAHYAASKAAAARYLDTLSFEAERDGVDVRWIAPGFIPTGFMEKGEWHGMDAPTVTGSGMTPERVAEIVGELLDGKSRSRVIGWRERAITAADRILPGAYDRLLRRRVRNV